MQVKRKYLRLEQTLSLVFERKGPTGTLRGQGTTRNISPTGLCFIVKTPLGVGEKIAIALALPETAHPLSFEGRIKWVHPLTAGSRPSYEVGVELSLLLGNDQNRYLLFICDLLCRLFAEQKRA